MKRWLFLFFALALTACASPAGQLEQPGKAGYPDLGAAPELVGNTWLNTAAPLFIADLQGKVVLLDMWTFG